MTANISLPILELVSIFCSDWPQNTQYTCSYLLCCTLALMVISEPGADQELLEFSGGWEDKVLVAEAMRAIEEALNRSSTDLDEQTHCERHRACRRHAQQQHALQGYLQYFLPPE